jgi:hypothetical protein
MSQRDSYNYIKNRVQADMTEKVKRLTRITMKVLGN